MNIFMICDEVKLKDLKTINKNQLYYWGEPKKIKLIEDIKESGFDSKKSVIKVTKDNYIIDGHHRCKILTDMFGGEHKVIVKRYFYSRKLYVFVVSIILIILSPIIIMNYILKNGFK